jgi:type I restriction enzyme, S subunit
MSEVAENNALPNEWRSMTLGELSEFVTSGSRNWSKYYANEGALFVRTQDIKHNRLSETDIPRVKLPEKAEGKRTRIYKGDLLITITGYIGRVAAVDTEIEEAYVSQSVALVRLRNPESSKFIQYQLLEKSRGATQLEAMAYGLGRPVLNLDNIRNAHIKIAPLDQQERIVAEIEKQFSRLDEAVANLKRVKANLKRYKAAVLKAAVEGRLVETEAELARREGRSYETGTQLLQRILETRRSQWIGKRKYKEPAAPDTTDLPELPEGWVWTTVEQLNIAQRPCAYGVLQPGDDLPDGVPFVRVGDINDGRVDLTSLKRISPMISAQYPRTKLAGGEFLITLVGAIGRTAVAPDFLSGANVARAVGVVPFSQDIDAHWTEIWFRNPAKISEMNSKSHEVARKTLNLEDVRVASVAVPPLSEQKRIVAEVDRRLSLVREIEAQVDANLKRAERLLQSILKTAFSGMLSQ